MAIQNDGEISMSDIVTEFTGTDPDSLFEYYRGAGLTTENNTEVPASGEISLTDFYGAIRIITKVVSTNTTNLVLTDLFNSTELAASAPKEVIINGDVTIGSNSTSLPAARSGTGYSGTLKLINNGWIYAAAGSGAGGTAFKAEDTITIDNQGRLYGGGGTGGVGGNGAGGWHYPEDITMKWTKNVYHWTLSNTSGGDSDHGINWAAVNIGSFRLATGTTEITTGGYTYQRGAFKDAIPGFIDYYELRRKLQFVQSGGVGGSGGLGKGYNQSQSNGSIGSTTVSTGGTGGNGGNWGVGGGTGGNGGAVNTSYTIETISATNGVSGGAAGHYIEGNSFVSWTNVGDVAGQSA